VSGGLVRDRQRTPGAHAASDGGQKARRDALDDGAGEGALSRGEQAAADLVLLAVDPQPLPDDRGSTLRGVPELECVVLVQADRRRPAQHALEGAEELPHVGCSGPDTRIR
jgi:hypothetical protein